MIQRILDLIKSGEGMTVEFKESRNKLNKDIYETVCSFLNRLGGDIILGVDDHGQIVGIEPDQVAPNISTTRFTLKETRESACATKLSASWLPTCLYIANTSWLIQPDW